MMILGMAFPNILGLYFLSSEVRKDLNNYLGRIKSGEIAKVK
jgi:AGCS family alanine or glycine:cation symporter